MSNIMSTDYNAMLQPLKSRFGIVGNSPALSLAVGRAARVAPFDLSVLIVGESGVGKEFFPKIIHSGSARKHNSYIAVNCGAIPEGTIDSELFGHEKGAFTGAVASRKGYFEEADGGTIFLDEVAELPLTTQARLLRVLETGEFIKVGSSVVQKTNIRVVAATNVDMAKAVADGRFREDLYYRLSTVQINVPPLRERGNDVVLLARKFAADFAERYRIPALDFDDSARDVLLSYRWPGNVRQLKNIIEQLSLFEAGTVVDRTLLQDYLPDAMAMFTPAVSGSRSRGYDQERELLFNMIFRLQNEVESLRSEIAESHRKTETFEPHPTAADITVPASRALTLHASASDENRKIIETEPVEQTAMTLEDTERETIRRSLDRNGGRRKATADELHISERTLYRKIKEYGLE